MQNLDGSTLGVLEFTSIAWGYRALDLLTRDTSVTVQEAAVQGSDHFLILVTGANDAVKRAEAEVVKAFGSSGTSQIRDREVIPDKNEKLVPTFYSLHTSQLGEALVVVETETVSGLFALSQRLLHSHKLEPIEIRSTRGSRVGGLGFFTGPSQACQRAADDARTLLSATARSGSVEVIDQPVAGFRDYFNLQNQ